MKISNEALELVSALKETGFVEEEVDNHSVAIICQEYFNKYVKEVEQNFIDLITDKDEG